MPSPDQRRALLSPDQINFHRLYPTPPQPDALYGHPNPTPYTPSPARQRRDVSPTRRLIRPLIRSRECPVLGPSFAYRGAARVCVRVYSPKLVLTTTHLSHKHSSSDPCIHSTLYPFYLATRTQTIYQVLISIAGILITTSYGASSYKLSLHKLRRLGAA